MKRFLCYIDDTTIETYPGGLQRRGMNTVMNKSETKALSERPPLSRSHLFAVRVWLEELGDGQVEWRGQVQHVLSGETGYFREWGGLVEFLLAVLSKVAGEDDSTRRAA